MRLRGDIRLQRGDFRFASGRFDWDLHGISVLFGPSGSGKSSVLLALAGVLQQVQGWLQIDDGPRWTLGRGGAAAAHRRGIGLVFQHAHLFPHLDVRGNLQFAARRAGLARQRMDELVAQTGLQDLLGRRVGQLSGGEAQRVAIARALLARPRLLCLDEPLSALDWSARRELLALIEALARDTDLPMIYVTHNAAEVERLAEQVIRVEPGRLLAPQSLQAALMPFDSPLFDEEGAASVLSGQLASDDAAGLLGFQSDGGSRLRLLDAGQVTGPARLRVRARDVSVARQPVEQISILNQLPVEISALSPAQQGRVRLRLRLNAQEHLLAEVTEWSTQALQLQTGQRVYALIKSVALLD